MGMKTLTSRKTVQVDCRQWQRPSRSRWSRGSVSAWMAPVSSSPEARRAQTSTGVRPRRQNCSSRLAGCIGSQNSVSIIYSDSFKRSNLINHDLPELSSGRDRGLLRHSPRFRIHDGLGHPHQPSIYRSLRLHRDRRETWSTTRESYSLERIARHPKQGRQSKMSL